MPFDNLEADPLMQEQDRKVHEDIPKWGNILPPIDPKLDPVLQAHEQSLRISYSYDKKPNGNWEIKPGFDPPGKRVWGNQPRGQVEVPPYSVQQGHAPGPYGMEQHQGGRVLGVSDLMREKREIEADLKRREQEQALAKAERTQPPRYKGKKQVEGYATIVTPLHGHQRVHVKSPEYKWAKKGKNGYRLPSDPTTRARIDDPAIPRGAVPPKQDLRNIPKGRRDEARKLDAANPFPGPPPPPAPPQANPAGAPMTGPTDFGGPGTQFVTQPGFADDEPYPEAPAGAPPPGGVYPSPTQNMRNQFLEAHNDSIAINPSTGEQWVDDEEFRKWFWDNRNQFSAGEIPGVVDEDGRPVRQGLPTDLHDRELPGRPPGHGGPWPREMRGISPRPPTPIDPRDLIRPENRWAAEQMQRQGQGFFTPLEGSQAPPDRTPPPGMMYGNRQAPPGYLPDPNVAVPGYTPGIDSREYPPFDPNMPFGYQQPAQEWTDDISAQARRRQRKTGGQAPLEEVAPHDFTEENRLLEEQIPEALPSAIDQRIRVGEPDPFAQPEETEDPFADFDPALRESARLTQSKIDAEERAAQIEHLIIQGEEEYLIDRGVLSRGEIARLKVELIREGKMEGESPAQRVIGGLVGATSPMAGEGSPLPTDPTEQLSILQRIKAKRVANRAARQQRRQ